MLITLTSFWGKILKCWAQPEIAISVLGDIIKIRGYYKDYQLSVTAVASMINKKNLEAVRCGSINHFAYDPIPWTSGVGRQIVESELALQWGIVEYLEKIYRKKDTDKLKQIRFIKETPFKHTKFLEKTKLPGTRRMVDKPGTRRMVDKGCYNIILMNRKHLEKLLAPL